MAVLINSEKLKAAIEAATKDLSTKQSVQYINDTYYRQFMKSIVANDRNINRYFSRYIRESALLIANMPRIGGPGFVDKQTQKQLDKLTRQLSKQLRENIDENTKAAWGLANDKTDAIVKTYIRDLPTSAIKKKGLFDRNLDALAAFKARTINGFDISDRVWRITENTGRLMNYYMESGISAGRPASKIAGDIVSLLQNPGKTINIEGKAFSVVDETFRPGRGVYKSPFKNARRLAATETNMAYRASDHERWKSTEWILGFQVRLSNNHTLNGEPFVDICDDLVGRYPKTFKFVGWHPLCYDDKTEVLTWNGWKQLRYVSIGEECFSLNKETFKVELVNVIDTQAFRFDGKMVHFKAINIDMLVTPDHPIIYIDENGDWQEKPASLFDGGFIITSLFYPDTRIFVRRKEYVNYSGMVYDLSLDRNHTLYLRRNGKYFWGSNCRCVATPILPDKETFLDIIMGEETQVNPVTDVPDGFRGWVDKHAEAVSGWKSQPYWVRDNFKDGTITGGLKDSIVK